MRGASPLAAPAREYQWLRLSPDGLRVAASIRGAATSDVWVYELARSTLARLTFDFDNGYPAWTPDGRRVSYRATRAEKSALFWAPADGSGAAEQLTDLKTSSGTVSWAPDSRTVVFSDGMGRRADVWALSLDQGRKPQPLLQSRFGETNAQLSADGRWLAYVSDESERGEVYVRPFPPVEGGGKWQVSTDGGVQPRWARSGRELFYRNGDRMMAVAISTRPAFHAGTPQVLFQEQRFMGSDYDVAPDGGRFLMMIRAGSQAPTGQFHVVVNWFEELKRRVPPP